VKNNKYTYLQLVLIKIISKIKCGLSLDRPTFTYNWNTEPEPYGGFAKPAVETCIWWICKTCGRNLQNCGERLGLKYLM